MKYVISFDSNYYNKLDLDNMSSEERWDDAKDDTVEINSEEAWRFYDKIAEPQIKHYINDYDGDLSVFWHGEDKSFWYECWIDLTDNWVSGEKIYLQVKDMDLREVGKFLFEKLCKYEAYYDSPQWIEDLNKMAECLK